jgi:hypothetical protein
MRSITRAQDSHTMRPRNPLLLFGVLLLASQFGLSVPAFAVTQIIGDPDGFGIDPTGLVRASSSHNDPADVDGDGIIEAGEYLPDWNGNGGVAVGSADEFDFRSAAEAADSSGAQWTDYAIIGGGSAHGAAFYFVFSPPQPGDFDYEDPHFINFLFGDYDVFPTSVDIDGETVDLDVQGSGEDGLVQVAFAPVPWSAMADGEVTVTVHAPTEPYLAFDYVLLDTDRLADSDGDGIPGSIDNCPGVPNLDQADSDGDGIGDVCDSCPNDADPGQEDSDGDGQGDVCDPCPEDATDDADGDGYCAPEDCDPTNGAVHPDALEVCDDGIDNDCDGTVDLLPDGDGDGWDECAGDCDDQDETIHPEADEGCNGIDNDCDGLLGPAELDGDGDGLSDCDGDCDDTDPDVFPGAPTACDPESDADCNGVADDAEAACGDDWIQADCSCSAAAAGSGAGVLGFLLVLGLLRRRFE